jgi:hypothetical protein
MILPNGPAPSNKNLVELAEKLKPLIRDLLDHSNMVMYLFWGILDAVIVYLY